jgi:hypothetical protein
MIATSSPASLVPLVQSVAGDVTLFQQQPQIQSQQQSMQQQSIQQQSIQQHKLASVFSKTTSFGIDSTSTSSSAQVQSPSNTPPGTPNMNRITLHSMELCGVFFAAFFVVFF